MHGEPEVRGASNAYMAWGRCLIFVGDSVDAPGSPEAPVRATVVAVYARTGTSCP